MENMSKISDDLFLGDIQAGRDSSVLGTMSVIDLSNSLPETPAEVAAIKASRGKPCLCLAEQRLVVMGIQDTDQAAADMVDQFAPICKFADAAIATGRPVLFHCFEGKSRSAVALIHYMMVRKTGANCTLLEAYRRVKAARPGIRLNNGFRQLLNRVELTLRPSAPSVQLKIRKKPKLSSARQRAAPAAAAAKSSPAPAPAAR